MTRLTLLTALQLAVLHQAWPGAAGRLAAPEAWLHAIATAPGVELLLLEVMAVVAPALALWLLAVTGSDLVTAARGGDRRSAPRWVRRTVDQALGTLLLIGAMAGPAAAGTVPDDVVVATTLGPVDDIRAPLVGPARPPRTSPPLGDRPPAGAPPDTGDADEPAPITDGPADPPADGPPIDPAEGTTDTHVVAAGENLWVIARGHLRSAGVPADDRTVHAHWVRLIQANQQTLISGDPDLIHPGEVLVLPPADRVT